jgi:hypothetical protein
MTRCVAIAVATLLAATPAWGHTFPPARTVVVQVERCELAVLVGYRPGTGEPTQGLLARIAAQPAARRADAARAVLGAYALAPLSFTLDGKPLVPTTVRAKIGVEPGGARPMVIVLVTYAMPAAGQLAISSLDANATRISWQDRDSHRVELDEAPAQAKWFDAVASFLLRIGSPACAHPALPRS